MKNGKENNPAVKELIKYLNVLPMILRWKCSSILDRWPSLNKIIGSMSVIW